MSDDLIIRAAGLRKSYRLHRSGRVQFIDLLRGQNRRVPEEQLHHALRGVDLEIRRGEKVAIIGRNGAGKSTLLKLVTQVIEPTSGTLEVRGESHALLQLGTGFHPDFTGRENAYSFLAYLGVVGKAAERLVEEAVEFAELEEYIDQPLKTYSTGMAARLMFAVSTVRAPQLLVVDEVLGVGDAYFQSKSFERIRELCDKEDTTLLLVSHDIYSAARIADRMIWIDRGLIHGDGPPEDIMRLYEDSIRLQEDTRQKAKLAAAYRREVGRQATPPAFLEFRARNNEPQRSPLWFAQIVLSWDDGERIDVPFLDEASSGVRHAGAYGFQLLPHTPWGEAGLIGERRARAWNNFGAVDHKAGFAIFPIDAAAADRLRSAKAVLSFYATDSVDADVVFIDSDGREALLGRLQAIPGEWSAAEFGVFGGTASSHRQAIEKASDDSGRHGTGRVVITNQEILDRDGKPKYGLQFGECARFVFDYYVNDPSMDELCQVLFAFKRNGVDDVCRVINRDVRFSAAKARQGRIEMALNPLRLGDASYTASIIIASEGYYEDDSGQFFSINPNVYDCRTHCLEFEVQNKESIVSRGAGYVADGQWTHHLSTSTDAGLDEASLDRAHSSRSA